MMTVTDAAGPAIDGELPSGKTRDALRFIDSR